MRILLMASVLSVPAFAAPIPREADDAAKKANVERLWKAAPPAYDLGDERLNPKAAIGDKGTVTLTNRGMLVTKEKRAKGSVSFAWKWTEGSEEYPDSLVVALRCDGTQSGRWSHEVPDGVLVRFSPSGGGTVSIEDMSVEESKRPAPVKMAFKWGTEYKIAVIDEGTRIGVVIDGKEVAAAEVKRGEDYTALYNREAVSSISHKSVLQYLRLEGPAIVAGR